MRQGIEINIETAPSKVNISVIFSDRRCVFECFGPFHVRARASLPRAVHPGDVNLLRLSAILTDGMLASRRRRKDPLTPLSSQENFSTEARNVRSVRPVFGAQQDKRGHTAAFNVISNNTEQRRCFAA